MVGIGAEIGEDWMQRKARGEGHGTLNHYGPHGDGGWKCGVGEVDAMETAHKTVVVF